MVAASSAFGVTCARPPLPPSPPMHECHKSEVDTPKSVSLVQHQIRAGLACGTGAPLHFATRPHELYANAFAATRKLCIQTVYPKHTSRGSARYSSISSASAFVGIRFRSVSPAQRAHGISTLTTFWLGIQMCCKPAAGSPRACGRCHNGLKWSCFYGQVTAV